MNMLTLLRRESMPPVAWQTVKLWKRLQAAIERSVLAWPVAIR
jgi:hypothetical protein